MTVNVKEFSPSSQWVTPGLFWLLVAFVGAAVFFADGLDALLLAWSLPEYSHGPLIPILSALLFLRQLKEYPIDTGPKQNRWAGVIVVGAALGLAFLGKLANIPDLVAYATILWIGGILLISFGWSTGKHFWPPVLHLVYMLPLPDTLYHKMSIWLQFISSELGVWFLRLLAVPVFLDGNIIDLGVTKLHVAEACSGLRYLFPILSFSYIFAVLYRGPMWHKAVLLLAAAPITVLMNSVRIAIAGYIVNNYGLEWVEGFSHFFEGWVIFIACILILFALARVMLFFHPVKMGLAEALDLETEGLMVHAARLRFVQPSGALIAAAILAVGASIAWEVRPERQSSLVPSRTQLTLFPQTIGNWTQQGGPRQLSASVEEALGADDYRSVTVAQYNGAPTVEIFAAWYADQANGGVHSPEICLPGGGWEISWLERVDISQSIGWPSEFELNRAIIQKGETRMMVYYWFEQKGKKIAWDLEAKYWLLVDGIITGRTDGAIVRLTTPIQSKEPDSAAAERLNDLLKSLAPILPRFIPE